MKRRKLDAFFAMEGLTNFWFKKDEANRTIFFPWSGFGKGRVIPDKTSEDKIRGCVGFHSSGMFSIGILVGVFAGVTSKYTFTFLVIYAAICALWLAWYYFEIRELVSGLPFSETKLTFVESYANYYSQWSNFTLLLALVFMSLFFVGSMVMVIGADTTVDRLIAVFCLLFSAWFVRTIGHVFRARRYMDASGAKGKDHDIKGSVPPDIKREILCADLSRVEIMQKYALSSHEIEQYELQVLGTQKVRQQKGSDR